VRACIAYAAQALEHPVVLDADDDLSGRRQF